MGVVEEAEEKEVEEEEETRIDEVADNAVDGRHHEVDVDGSSHAVVTCSKCKTHAQCYESKHPGGSAVERELSVVGTAGSTSTDSTGMARRE